jgi:hypothetical protein
MIPKTSVGVVDFAPKRAIPKMCLILGPEVKLVGQASRQVFGLAGRYLPIAIGAPPGVDVVVVDCNIRSSTVPA